MLDEGLVSEGGLLSPFQQDWGLLIIRIHTHMTPYRNSGSPGIPSIPPYWIRTSLKA